MGGYTVKWLLPAVLPLALVVRADVHADPFLYGLDLEAGEEAVFNVMEDNGWQVESGIIHTDMGDILVLAGHQSDPLPRILMYKFAENGWLVSIRYAERWDDEETLEKHYAKWLEGISFEFGDPVETEDGRHYWMKAGFDVEMETGAYNFGYGDQPAMLITFTQSFL